MKSASVLLAAVGALLGACSSGSIATDGSPKAAVLDDAEARKIVEETIATTEKNLNTEDFDKYMAVVADDAVFFFPSMPELNGKKAIAEFYAGTVKMFDAKVRHQINGIRVDGDVIYAWGEAEGTMTSKSDPAQVSTAKNKYLWILKKQPSGRYAIRFGAANAR